MGQTSEVEQLLLIILQYIIVVPAIFVLTVVTSISELFKTHIPAHLKSDNSPESHAQKVIKIQEQVLDWNRNGRKGKMCTGRPSWLTVSLRNYEKTNYAKIMMGDLSEIIELDTRNKLLRVEPGITMGALTSKLLPMGWTIPVIPELEFLTVGGVICGAGLETSSHKYGLFGDSCVSFEVVLADGSLVNCSKNENPDLFYAIGMSHGTIGFLTAVTIPLIPAAKYVKLEYIHSKSNAKTVELLNAPENEFIEGIMYDSANTVVMYGNFVNQPPPNSKINNLRRFYKPWFYKHAEGFLNQPGRHIEYIPTRDYYHRHTRSLFWEMEMVLPIGNHPLFRYFLGWLLPIDFQVLKYTLPTPILNLFIQKKQHLIQDFILPLDKIKKSIEFSDDICEIYPIWLCPVVGSVNPGMTHSKTDRPEMFVDIGIYGDSKKELKDGVKETVRKFEKFILENDGFQGLYADNYLTRKEFEQMFDLKLYEKVRKDLKCNDAFPHVYDKVSHIARKL